MNIARAMNNAVIATFALIGVFEQSLSCRDAIESLERLGNCVQNEAYHQGRCRMMGRTT